MSSSEKCLFMSFAHFWIGFFVVKFYKFFLNFGYYPLSGVSVNMLCRSVCCVFLLLMLSFPVQKILVSWSPICLFFPFVSLAWEDMSDKILLWAMSDILLPVFSSRVFMDLSLTLKFLIHFELNLLCSIRRWSSFVFLHLSVQFSKHRLLSKLYFYFKKDKQLTRTHGNAY